MSNSIALIISLSLMLSFIRCEKVTIFKGKDKFDKERQGTLMVVEGDCFSLFFNETESVLKFDGSEKSMSNFRGISGVCPTAVKSTDEQDKTSNTETASITFQVTAQDERTGAKELQITITTVHDKLDEQWSLQKAEVKNVNTSEIVQLDVEHMTAPTNHSFSCSGLELHKSLKVDSSKGFAKDFNKLTLRDFQIQPFKGKIFEDSYDCATWFTIGTFAGLLVLILFTSILAIGILYIMNIKTNDRFEDPKGKPLNLGNTDN